VLHKQKAKPKIRYEIQSKYNGKVYLSYNKIYINTNIIWLFRQILAALNRNVLP